jgi:hypothetical protein
VRETAAGAEPGSAETAVSGVSEDAARGGKLHPESLTLGVVQATKHRSPAPREPG